MDKIVFFPVNSFESYKYLKSLLEHLAFCTLCDRSLFVGRTHGRNPCNMDIGLLTVSVTLD